VRWTPPQCLEFLAAKGLPVDRERRLVRFPRAAIEDALSHAPARFEVFDREGGPGVRRGDGRPRIAAGHNAVFWLDQGDGGDPAVHGSPTSRPSPGSATGSSAST